MPRRSPAEVEAAIEQALTELADTGEPFRQSDVIEKTGISSAYFTNHPDIREKVQEVVRKSKGDSDRPSKPKRQAEKVPRKAPQPKPVGGSFQKELDYWNAEVRRLFLELAKAQGKVELLNELAKREASNG